MKLMTKELKKKFAKQGDTSMKQARDIKIIAKYFNPFGAGTWYCFEYWPEDRVFMAFVNLIGPENAEIGTVSLDELQELVIPPLGLGIERDLYFGDDHTLQQVMDKVHKGVHV